MSRIRVFIADDHALFRAGCRRIVESFDGVDVVGEAATGTEVLTQAATLHPDVILADIAMPELNGIETTAQVVERFPGSRVVILSMHTHESWVASALRAGASGYVVKDASPAELEMAIRAVARGDVYLSPSVAKNLVEDYLRRPSGASGLLERLTPRQRQVLRLIATGHTRKAIARELDISVKTAETHRAELMDRLDIHDLAGLIRFAIRTGLVPPES